MRDPRARALSWADYRLRGGPNSNNSYSETALIDEAVATVEDIAGHLAIRWAVAQHIPERSAFVLFDEIAAGTVSVWSCIARFFGFLELPYRVVERFVKENGTTSDRFPHLTLSQLKNVNVSVYEWMTERSRAILPEELGQSLIP